VAVIEVSSLGPKVCLSSTVEEAMTFEPGEVVMLKSGGQLMTVVASEEGDVDCVWIGDEGHFFRENIPAAALVAVKSGDHDEDEDEADEEDESDEEDDTSESKRKVA
jgi:uncharacterized protein YodC (DUF2158 family)